jgi:sugar/nucleoside kinase (ribokinase family)
MKLDLIGLGSAIVDFAPAEFDVTLDEVRSFVPSAGGAVANIVVAASRLGLKTGFLGCVGDDEFGAFIMHDFVKEGVDISRVKTVKGRATGIAFYSVDEKGERHYAFYRFPGYSDPESAFMADSIDSEYVAGSKMLHLSEAMVRQIQTRETALKVLHIAKENGVQVSYDPNVRETLWSSREEFFETQRKVLSLVDIFLSTLEEANFIVGEQTGEETAKRILALGPSTLVLREKSHYQVRTPHQSLLIPVTKVRAVDTSGAGDAFDAGFLTGLINRLPLDKAVLLGSSVAALKVVKVGTRSGLPSLKEAANFMRKREKFNSKLRES